MGDVSTLLPREVAERYCCFPLEAGPGALVLAVAAPLDAGLNEELCFALGVQIEERVALEVRIRQAIFASLWAAALGAQSARHRAPRRRGRSGAPEAPLGLWPETQLSSLPRPPSERPPSVHPRPRASARSPNEPTGAARPQRAAEQRQASEPAPRPVQALAGA